MTTNESAATSTPDPLAEFNTWTVPPQVADEMITKAGGRCPVGHSEQMDGLG